ncbi:AAA family ATPase [Chloroflexota bacterium]
MPKSEEYIKSADGSWQLADTYPDYEPCDNGIKLRCIANVQLETVSWLWSPYLPKGKVTLLEGDPGIGKSWATLAMATAITLGKGLPGQQLVDPSSVVIASAEDGLGDTIRPRLDVMGADISHIFAIDGALTLDETGFTLLESYLERVRPTLLIIDPLVAYVGAGVDIHRANETRTVMSQLARLAEKFNVAILAVRHLTKGNMSKAIYRGLGSIDFTAACRSVLLAGCDSEDQQNRALVHIKSNLAPTGPAIGYELREGGFYWTGESSLTAGQILAAESSTGISDLDEAITFLKDMLGGEEVPANDIYKAAQGTGIAKRTIERAKAKLQAKSRKTGNTWFWYLPLPTSPTLPYKEFGEHENIEAKKENITKELGDVEDDLSSCPATPCSVCGCGSYWQRAASQWGKAEWLCSHCHPKLRETIVTGK